MTAILTIGRLGLDVALEDPSQMGVDVSDSTRQLRIGGELLSDSLLKSKVLRDQLVAMTGRIIPVTWTGDSDIDGYYRLRSANVDVQTLNANGFFPFNVTLEHVGSDADLAFRSLLTTAVRSNDHGVTLAESEPVHAPPGGHGAYSAVIGSVTRKSEDGDVVVYRDITDTRPSWSSTPGAYLNGACKITSGGYVRSGLSHQNDSEDWTLENGLVRVRPRRKSWGYGGSSETPNTNQPLLLPYSGTQYLYLPGVANNHATVPDPMDESTLDEIDLIIDAWLDDYGSSLGQDLVNHWEGGTTPSLWFRKYPGLRKLQLIWKQSDGTQIFGAASSDLPTDLQRAKFRVHIDINNGAAQTVASYYYSIDGGNTWVSLGSATGGDGTLADSDSPLRIGSRNGPSDVLQGKVYGVEVWPENSTNPGAVPLVDIDFTDETALVEPFASFTENTGKTVTINRSSSGRVTTVVDQSQFITGTDDTLTAILGSDLAPNDGDHTIFGIARIADDTPAVDNRLFSSKGVGAGFYYLAVPTTGNIFVRYNDGTNNLQQNAGAPINALTRHSFAGRIDRTTDLLSAFVDGTEYGTPIDISTLGSVDDDQLDIGAANTGGAQPWEGSIMVALTFNEALTAAELAELSSWDGTIANEPTWLRTHPTLVLYVNADDPDQQAAYMGDNQLINLADNALTGGALANEVGSIEVEHYNGSDWLSKIWELQTPAGTELPAWEWVSILRNDPEEAIVRLEASVSGGGRNTLDLTLRRGSRFVEGRLTIPSSGTIKVVRGVTEAGQAVTPAGASSAVGVEASADDDYGNRYLVGTPSGHTADTTIGGVSKGSATSLGFFIGAELGGSNAQAGDTSESLCLQHLGLVAETVRSLRR